MGAKRILVALSVLAVMSGCAATDSSENAFVTEVKEGRLWVFRPDSKDYQDFVKTGEPAKQVTRIGAGPNGITIKAPSAELVNDYVYGKEGFYTEVKDGRLWVFNSGSKDLEGFLKTGEPAKQVTRIGAGPNGITLKGPSAEVLEDYVYGKVGFFTRITDGRLWVFAEGSKDLEGFMKTGEPAKQVTRIGAGPNGITIKAPSIEVVDAYTYN